jgi:hypothetical protein
MPIGYSRKVTPAIVDRQNAVGAILYVAIAGVLVALG